MEPPGLFEIQGNDKNKEQIIMKRLTLICMALALVGLPAWAQKIETQKPDRNRIVHVQTAMNHLTVIEVDEPVSTVAAGSSAFKIEWRDNKVFVQPTEPSAATNLFIWTVSGRLNYELEPAGAVEQMDFAIDQPPIQTDSKPLASAKPPSSAVTSGVSADALLGGRPIRVGGSKEPRNQVVVLLKDVFERDNETFIRYVVRNGSKESYGISTPQVFTLNVLGSPKALDGLSNTQLLDNALAHLTSDGHSPVEVVDGEVRSPRIAPGQETVGVVGVKLPPARGRTVLLLVFPDHGTAQPTATLVL